ncbi:HNH endonuclease [Polaromonas sp. YR568]|uniref:HNH endonuclease n=1 Tax=Polaromonas sp. YR568 TaxID=1855301 RepID=UPI003137BB0C
MTASQNWTRKETLAALHIYLQLPFGQLHHRNAKIKQLAQWIGRTPGSVALKLVNLASLDPQIVASGRRGMGNASKLDQQIWQELLANWDSIALSAAAEFDRLAVSHGLPAAVDVIDEVPEIVEGKTKSVLIQARVNQVRFRRAILASYNSTCCISGLNHEKLVIASHIVPWSVDKANRLNPQNGLCLSALHDRAYDQGLLTVLPDHTIRIAQKLKGTSNDRFMRDALLRYDGKKIRLPEKFRPDQKFLEAHASRFEFI